MSQLSFFNSQKAEYFFLISPGIDGIEKVTHLKKLLHGEFRIREEDLVAVPHITLFKIALYEEDEQDFLTKGSDVLASFESSVIESMGVGFFKHPMASTHFVKISKSDLVQGIGQSLYANFTRKRLNITPHITVAKMMPLDQHGAIQNMLVDNYKPFSFLLDRVLVLKWRSGAKRYEVLGNLGVGRNECL